MTAATDSFFDESREQSVVKAEIVEKYFDAWAGIITGAQDRLRSGEKRIAYVDLFSRAPVGTKTARSPRRCTW